MYNYENINKVIISKTVQNLIGWVLDLINLDEKFQMSSIPCGNSVPIHYFGKDSKTTSGIKQRKCYDWEVVSATDTDSVDRKNLPYRQELLIWS